MTDFDADTITREELSTRIFFRIYQCDNLINRNVTRLLETYGITSQQWAVIGALAHPRADEGMTVGSLSQLLKVSRQNITGILTRLTRRGLISKSTDAVDTRARRIKLTRKGKQVWEQVYPAVIDHFHSLLHDGASADENIAFLDRLNRLIETLDKPQG